MKTRTLPLKHSMNLSPVRLALLFIPFVLACFALSPQARAACQEGCLTNENTVLGEDALLNNTTGGENTAIGAGTLSDNTDGYWNTATGADALFNNTTGHENTAIGFDVLFSNNTGNGNTAVGTGVMGFNTTGSANTATGWLALDFNTTGHRNTAIGSIALFGNTTGNENTAVGGKALFNNTTGNGNIALGVEAGLSIQTGSNNIEIGNLGVADESNTIRIGRVGRHTHTFIAGISGITVPAGVGAIVGTSGQLGTTTSSARFKDGIKPMDKASEAILALKPVTFRYKHDLDPEGIPQFGLVAEQVEKVNPDLVARDEQGKPYSVRYEAVNAMLLNEFLKEHREVQEQKATIAEFKREIADLTATVKQQSAQIQKVSAQLELGKSAPQTVTTNR